MKRSALALLVFLLFTSVSFAQQNDADAPASKADIEHYLDTMHMRDLMKNMMSWSTRSKSGMRLISISSPPMLAAMGEPSEHCQVDHCFSCTAVPVRASPLAELPSSKWATTRPSGVSS